ncbi:MAG: 30S ribosomal protein S12 methylthiotransferase RimO [Bacillota bacterium]|jgi:ribosomal protein S12 methylthiotransferase
MPDTLRIYLRSLGCAKNLVDSEMMSGLLLANKFQLIDLPQEADIIIVNTCGFIQAAKEEAIDNILELAQYKQSGRCRLLVAVGCMVEKYRQQLMESLPEVDAFLGTQEYEQIAELIKEKLSLTEKQPALPKDFYLLRSLCTPGYLAYLKIAEGCNNHCSYCVIPQLRGAYKSRTMEDILKEASILYEQGVKELIVIAQDVTNYGYDLYQESRLACLLEQLVEIPFVWIRLLYVYPSSIDEELLCVMSRHKNICHYLDIPLQHGDDEILAAMNRRGSSEQIKDKIKLIRSYMPDIALRTTIMVGFPGEKKRHFANLLRFLQEIEFDWVGVFKYCREPDTIAADLPAQVHKDAKARREEKAMTLLARLTSQRLARHIGQVLQVLVEKEVAEKPGWYQGRSQYHAPEVDGLIFFPAHDLQEGEFVQIKITGCDTYDLIGEMI